MSWCWQVPFFLMVPSSIWYLFHQCRGSQLSFWITIVFAINTQTKQLRTAIGSINQCCSSRASFSGDNEWNPTSHHSPGTLLSTPCIAPFFLLCCFLPLRSKLQLWLVIELPQWVHQSKMDCRAVGWDVYQTGCPDNNESANDNPSWEWDWHRDICNTAKLLQMIHPWKMATGRLCMTMWGGIKGENFTTKIYRNFNWFGLMKEWKLLSFFIVPIECLPRRWWIFWPTGRPTSHITHHTDAVKWGAGGTSSSLSLSLFIPWNHSTYL